VSRAFGLEGTIGRELGAFAGSLARMGIAAMPTGLVKRAGERMAMAAVLVSMFVRYAAAGARMLASVAGGVYVRDSRHRGG
jgi:hypothetical protein